MKHLLRCQFDLIFVFYVEYIFLLGTYHEYCMTSLTLQNKLSFFVNKTFRIVDFLHYNLVSIFTASLGITLGPFMCN